VETCSALPRLIRGAVPLDTAVGIAAQMAVDGGVRAYWRTVQTRIYAGVPPQKALAIPPMGKLERDQLTSFQTVDQLADAMDTIAEDRRFATQASQKRLVLAGIVFLVLTFTAVMMLGIWLVMLQNDGLLQSINGMRN